MKGNEKVILSAVQWFKGTHFICLFFIYLQSVLIYLFFFFYCPSFSCQLLHWLSKFFMFFCFDFVFFFICLFVLNISLSNLLSVLMKTHQNKFKIFFFFAFCLSLLKPMSRMLLWEDRRLLTLWEEEKGCQDLRDALMKCTWNNICEEFCCFLLTHSNINWNRWKLGLNS